MAERTISTIITDMRLAVKRKGGVGAFVKSIFLHAGAQAIALFRISHWLYLRGFENLALLVMRINLFLCNVEIQPDTEIGPDFHLPHPLGIVIGPRTTIGRGVYFYSGTSAGALWEEGKETRFTIKDHVMIYHGARVGGDCTIGEFARIGVCAVSIGQDIPPYATVVGNPGRVVKIGDRKVNPDDYMDYKYDPADYHGPPPGIELDY